ncbi:hypothetical protein EL18_02474 [Nitratireductor basaltis]|uniref:Uncharacterized protein n=1 Tax=Nitratireductor basaltis TaxID=472175 RepID=A0A084UEP0_9HYPH|nr:hypothetical protein EL18_02474 [Nitratireductor basaltis]
MKARWWALSMDQFFYQFRKFADYLFGLLLRCARMYHA